MVVAPRSQRLILPVAPLVAGVIAVLTAGLFALVPTDLLEQMAVDSGVASVLSAAEPPLGFTARLVLVLLCGGGVGLIAWFALFLALGARTIVVQRAGGTSEAPVLRRADAHPDAPARRPLFANTDLGTPFLDVRARPVHVDAAQVKVAAPAAPPVEQPLPVDLDQPLAAFDPGALPDEPLDWFPPAAELKLAPRQQIFEPTERFETFPLTPVAQPDPPAPPAADAPVPPVVRAKADPSETIHALLDRLERVANRRESAKPAEAISELSGDRIEDSLTTLRRMAGGR